MAEQRPLFKTLLIKLEGNVFITDLRLKKSIQKAPNWLFLMSFWDPLDPIMQGPECLLQGSEQPLLLLKDRQAVDYTDKPDGPL